jgi:glycerol-3-phosphate dehydrogenase
MHGEGDIAEGYHAILHGYEYAKEIDPNFPAALPILTMLRRIILDECPARDAIMDLVGEFPLTNLHR